MTRKRGPHKAVGRWPTKYTSIVLCTAETRTTDQTESTRSSPLQSTEAWPISQQITDILKNQPET